MSKGYKPKDWAPGPLGERYEHATCWDCGSIAPPGFESADESPGLSRIGWQCGCGRWWPVTSATINTWVKHWNHLLLKHESIARQLKKAYEESNE